MCGIAGVVDLDGTVAADVEPLLATIRHRGPDSSGAYIRPGAAIGQTRLAVIDLVTGDPPIANEDGSLGVSFNGEIYNYAALREDLIAAGHELKTTGDTEVIVHLAEDLSPMEVARRLDGMFAFAVWDSRRRRLVLGRDRFGKKPLYYWTDGRRLAFGSEIKAVLADPSVPRRLDQGALPAYLTFGYVPTPRTFYEGIRSLPPAHVLSFDADGLRVERYWSLDVPGRDAVSEVDLRGEQLRTELRQRVRDAVSKRLVADVPLGAFLSGGVDSSVVVATMASLSRRPVRTFTIGFDDKELFDERPFAAEVARLFGTEHTEFVVSPDKIELIDELVRHYDQPFGDSSALNTYVLSELTKKHVTVALCGDGGDELFAGYERVAAAVALDRFDRLPSFARRGAQAALARLPQGLMAGRAGSASRMLSRSGLSTPRAHLSWLSVVPDDWRRRLLAPVQLDGWGFRDYERVWDESAGAALVDRLRLLNIDTYLLDDLLPKVDRTAMAHALEVRSPFLDRELAEFVMRLPARQLVLGFSLKRALRDAFSDTLPKHILNRRKRGFGVPLDRWFRTDLAPYVQAMLCSSQSRVREHLDADAVVALVAEHQSGLGDHGHAIWSLLTLEIFLRNNDW